MLLWLSIKLSLKRKSILVFRRLKRNYKSSLTIHLITADISLKKIKTAVGTDHWHKDRHPISTDSYKKQKTKTKTQVLRLSPPTHIHTSQPASKAQLAKKTQQIKAVFSHSGFTPVALTAYSLVSVLMSSGCFERLTKEMQIKCFHQVVAGLC